jgi:hypothetical protein
MKNATEQTSFGLPATSAACRRDREEPAIGEGLYRCAEDDFFCLRFQVWYPSLDCAVRTRYRTAPGCRDCEQGRFNFKRHRSALLRTTRSFRLV